MASQESWKNAYKGLVGGAWNFHKYFIPIFKNRF